jgi:eukaryotic-like serine/threonine-protein kinase
MPLSAGDKLGAYEIVAQIGAGGMGEVYRAKDTKLGRQVAIKVLPGHLAADTSARERLRREAVAAAALDHPFICKVFEIGEHDGALFLVMEFIAGDTLHRRLRSGSLPLPEALRISGEVAEALEEAHNQQFVHRDLKPANVMLTVGGHAKVMDFGLAKKFTASAPAEDAGTATMAEPSLTEIGSAIGTPDYMSPEQVRGEALDQRSDLFSFGVLLCDLLGSAHPFRRASTTETMAAILRDPPNLSGDLPQGLMVLIRRLLAKSRDDRYQSMAEVREDLLRLAATPAAAAVDDTRIPLIGREQEFAELKRALEEALAGRGSLIMVGGEPGIGKTHLTGALLEEAKRRGAFAVVGHCYEMEGAPPYVPFIEMLEYSARTAPRESLRYVLGDGAPEVAKLMPELRNMYPDMPAAIKLPPEQQRRFLFNAYRSFVERSARLTPIVAVYEDLHWADEPTLLLLQHLAQTISATPMLLIGTYRDVELEVTRPFAKTLETLVRQKQATRMTLRRLPLGGVGGMLAAMSGQTPPPSLARVVFEETEGNPFFVEEVFRHLAEEGRLFDETGKWRQGLRVDQLQVPEGVRLVLGRRLERLGEGARRALTTAAVIGRSFSLRLLEELENKQPDAALEAVEEAERAHIVVAEPAGRDTRYRFVHELVRQTLAETLSLPRRQRLHARVAEAIERAYSANLDAHASALAHHLYQAGAAADPEKTTTYLMLAAQQARAGAAHEEALVHLDNALAVCEGETSIRVAELMQLRAGALHCIGRSDEAEDSYQKAIALFEKEGAVTKAAGTSLVLGMIQAWRIEFTAGNRTIERALDHLGSAEPHLQMNLLSARAYMVSCSGDATTAASLLAEARALQKGTEGQRIAVYNEMHEAICRLHLFQWEQAVTGARQAAQTYRTMGDLWAATDAEWWVGYEMFLGRTAEAAEYLRGALKQAQRVGHHSAVWMAKWLCAWLSAAHGDLTAAGQAMEDAWNFGEVHENPWNFIPDTLRGQLAFLRGNFSEAECWFRHRPEIEMKTSLSGWRDSCLFAALAETNDDRAWKAWTDRRWKSPLIGQPNHIGAWIALERSVTGLAWLGKREEVAALRPLCEGLVLTGVWAFSYLSPFRTAAGIAAACAGDWSAAEQHHLTAIHQTDTAPYRVSQPMAREWYATMLLGRNSPADAAKARVLLSEALAMYESMGMPFHANRTSGKLATL